MAWTDEHREWHSTHREALATHLAIQHLGQKIPPGVRLILKTDSTPVCWAWRQGTTNRRINALTAWAVQFLHQRKIHPTAEHIAGRLNRRADYLSRNPDPKNYQLLPSIFATICNKLRVSPEIDIFASKENHQLPSYCSWRNDRNSQGNAFHLTWSGKILWANPPWELIPRFLQKLARDKTTALVCLPVWKSAPWWGMVVAHMMTRPIILRNLPIFRNPQGDLMPPPRWGTIFTVLRT